MDEFPILFSLYSVTVSTYGEREMERFHLKDPLSDDAVQGSPSLSDAAVGPYSSRIMTIAVVWYLPDWFMHSWYFYCSKLNFIAFIISSIRSNNNISDSINFLRPRWHIALLLHFYTLSNKHALVKFINYFYMLFSIYFDKHFL